MKKTGRNFNCETCGKEFYRAMWQIKSGPSKFCNLKCRRHTQETKDKISSLKKGQRAWNKGMSKKELKKHYLNGWKGVFEKGHDKGVRFGRDKQVAGENHWNWKGGIYPEVMRLRKSKEMCDWKLKIFERDKYTCQICSRKGGELCADHILPFSKYPLLRFELRNGRTLCKGCHLKTETYGEKSKNIEEDDLWRMIQNVC